MRKPRLPTSGRDLPKSAFRWYYSLSLSLSLSLASAQANVQANLYNRRSYVFNIYLMPVYIKNNATNWDTYKLDSSHDSTNESCRACPFLRSFLIYFAYNSWDSGFGRRWADGMMREGGMRLSSVPGKLQSLVGTDSVGKSAHAHPYREKNKILLSHKLHNH
jgi:hypothetical protein